MKRSLAMHKILIIKHGAMGDFFCSVAAFAAIRKTHPSDHLILLTTRPYVDLAHALGYFDEILIDLRPRLYQYDAIKKLRNLIRSVKTVYDLQCSDRTKSYRLLSLFEASPEWLCMPWDGSWKTKLACYSPADLPPFAPADFSRFTANLAHFGIRSPFALIVPGSSKRHADDKRWPIENYIEVARHIQNKGIQPVVVGGADEDFSEQLSRNHFILDISGKTGLVDLVAISNAACLAVGNDTGVMHLAAACGVPVVVLMSGTRPPEWGARGTSYRHLVRNPVTALSVSEVTEAFDMLCPEARANIGSLPELSALEQDRCNHA